METSCLYLQIDVGESVRVDIGTHTDDPLVTKLWTFQGWNSLEVLEVYIHDWRENANSPSQVICITPLDLPDIAKCCPKLQQLVINVIFPLKRGIMEKMQKVLDDGKTSPRHGLKQLDFSDIHIPLLTEDDLDGQDYQDAHEVLFAEYLNIVFPSLEGVYFVAGDANAKQWCAKMETVMADLKSRNKPPI